jgi:hypothetical protein
MIRRAVRPASLLSVDAALAMFTVPPDDGALLSRALPAGDE